MSWVTLAAFAAGVAAFWGQLKTLFTQFSSHFVQPVKVHYSLTRAVQGYLWHNCKPSNYGQIEVKGQVLFRKKANRYETVAVEQVGDSKIFWVGRCPILATFKDWQFYLYIPRGFIDAKPFIQEALRWYNEVNHAGLSGFNDANPQPRYVVHHLPRPKDVKTETDSNGKKVAAFDRQADDLTCAKFIGCTLADVGQPVPADPFDGLVFEGAVPAAIEEIKRWWRSEQWYREHAIIWQLGALFYGPPGTGKSSLARALAQMLNIPIYAIDLNSLDDNQALMDAWAEARANSPSMILMEDFDETFKKRENVRKQNTLSKPGISFDALLNCMSGIEPNWGVLTVITTNRIEYIDEALGLPTFEGQMSSRPGRIDLVLEMAAGMSVEGRESISRRVCGEVVPEVIAAGVKDSQAQFKERCRQFALRRYCARQEAA